MWISTGIGWLDAANAWFIEHVVLFVAAVFVSAVGNYLTFCLPVAGLIYAVAWLCPRLGISLDLTEEQRRIHCRGRGMNWEPDSGPWRPLPPLRERIAYRWRSALARLR